MSKTKIAKRKMSETSKKTVIMEIFVHRLPIFWKNKCKYNIGKKYFFICIKSTEDKKNS